MFTIGIYLIENLVNGKIYVGSSQFLGRRWEEHCRELRKGRHYSRHLQGAWLKHGETNFRFLVVEYCSLEELVQREAWWVLLLGTRQRGRGYNLGGMVAGIMSEEVRAKMSASQKGRPRPDLIGRKQSPEEKANQIAAQKGKSGLWNKGRKHTEEHKAKVAAVRVGRKHSEETKAKIGAAHRGKPRSPEAVEKTAAAKRGSKQSDEAKARISAGLNAYWAARRAARREEEDGAFLFTNGGAGRR